MDKPIHDLGELRHLARSLEGRLRGDESFLSIVAHFVRWKAPWTSWMTLDQLAARLDRAHDFRAELLRRSLEEQEAFVRIQETWLLGEGWFLGMPLPPPVEINFPLSEGDAARLYRRWDDLVAWLRARRGRLRFDPVVGRFVETQAGRVNHPVPVPAGPLPGWTGPVPQVPWE